MTPEIPTSVGGGRYAIGRPIGMGAQATTFEAVDKQLGALVAIKQFRVLGARSWKDVELAEREARVLASLSHPLLPRYLDHFEEDGCLYLVMDRVEGESLKAMHERGIRFSQADVLTLLRDAEEVFRYLHGRAPPIVHRDVKPGNVIQRPDGRFCLVDFGAVRDRITPKGGSTVVGTFGYMAPEQFQGRAMPASDLYALGATVLWMLTGTEPEDLPHQGLAIDVRNTLGGTCDPALLTLLEQLLEPNPDLRATALAPLLARFDAHDSADAGAARSGGGSHRPFPKADGSRREEWRAPHWEHGPGLPPPILAIVLVALELAKFGVWLLFGVLLPVVLTVLSGFVRGDGLNRAARRCEEVGRAGQRGLRIASERVRDMGRPHPRSRRRRHGDARRHRAEWRPPPAEPHQRVSDVAPEPRARVADPAPDETEEHDPPPTNRRRRAER